MRKCLFCKREGIWPDICMNTRDAEDRAIDGNETCFEGIAKAGWGEKGERYIRLNKAVRAKERTRMRVQRA